MIFGNLNPNAALLITHSFNYADVPKFKRYLKAGHLHCIGTTTPHRYDAVIRQYGSSDFLSDIQVDEPSVSGTVKTLRTLSNGLTTYHGGKFGVEDALHQAVNIAKRFLALIVALSSCANSGPGLRSHPQPARSSF